jgi:hypothetical protein
VLSTLVGAIVFLGVAWRAGARGAAVGIPLSAAAGFGLHALIERRRTPLGGQLGALLGRSASAIDLRRSMAVDLDKLVAACRALDQAIMAKTVGMLVLEYDRAKKSSDRQEALVKAVTLMEKLVEKLQPWYVRHQKAITWGVTAMGSVVGIAKSVVDILVKTGGIAAGR